MKKIVLSAIACLTLSACFEPGGWDGLTYAEKARYVSSACEDLEGTKSWRTCINDAIKRREGNAERLNQTMRGVAAAAASMSTYPTPVAPGDTRSINQRRSPVIAYPVAWNQNCSQTYGRYYLIGHVNVSGQKVCQYG